MGINFLESQAPDSTALVKFRKLLVDNDIQIKMQYELTRMLDEQGFIMHGGTITDAAIINAPKSTKNQEHKRDPEMASTKKNNQYYFGAKAHIGTDAGTGLVLDVETTDPSGK
jgi:IS5 family transposase